MSQFSNANDALFCYDSRNPTYLVRLNANRHVAFVQNSGVVLPFGMLYCGAEDGNTLLTSCVSMGGAKDMGFISDFDIINGG